MTFTHKPIRHDPDNPSTHYLNAKGQSRKFPRQHPNSIAARKRNMHVGHISMAKGLVNKIAKDLGLEEHQLVFSIIFNLNTMIHIAQKQNPNPLPIKEEIK